MNVLHFLTERTRFIRTFYEGASAPFVETKRRIEAMEPPFVPPYGEDDEPPFMSEWFEADAALEVLGRTGVSMLSDGLKLYFLAWERELGLTCRKPRAAFRISDYKACLTAASGVDWNQAPFDLDVVEQIILARNDAQHPADIETMTVTHRNGLNKPGRRLFFVSDHERDLVVRDEAAASIWGGPRLKVSKDALWVALNGVDAVAEWLEPRLLDTRYPGRRRAAE